MAEGARYVVQLSVGHTAERVEAVLVEAVAILVEDFPSTNHQSDGPPKMQYAN